MPQFSQPRVGLLGWITTSGQYLLFWVNFYDYWINHTHYRLLEEWDPIIWQNLDQYPRF